MVFIFLEQNDFLRKIEQLYFLINYHFDGRYHNFPPPFLCGEVGKNLFSLFAVIIMIIAVVGESIIIVMVRRGEVPPHCHLKVCFVLNPSATFAAVLNWTGVSYLQSQ